MNVQILMSTLVAMTLSRADLLPLSSLPGRCTVNTVMMAHFGIPRLSAVVNCGCDSVRATGPESFDGLVRIETPAAALEYVRFFSTERTYHLFAFGEIVEIAGFGRDRLTPDGRYLIANEFKREFERVFHSPEVREQGGNHAGKVFKIKRVVVATDGHVYDLDEMVSDTGSYAVVSRTKIFNNASRIGLVHVGDI